MARARNIKPAFFKNEDLADLPAEVRLLFIGLWTLADREGRLEDRPKRIKAELFAFESFDVDSMLNQLQTSGFVTRYEVSGLRLLQVVNFVKHQDPHYKERASELPAPPGEANAIQAVGITRETRARIMERDGYKCRQCSAEEYLSIDHVVPASRGGSGEDSNLQVLCLKCNGSKGNKLPGEQKGARRSKHNDTSIRTRPELESKSVNGHTQNPVPAPLTPDSGFLIPDSLIPEEEGGPAQKALAPPPPAFCGEKNESAIPVKAKVPLADGWELPEPWGTDAEKLGFAPSEILRESEKFRQYYVSGKGAGRRSTLRGWRQSWSNWLSKAETFRRAH